MQLKIKVYTQKRDQKQVRQHLTTVNSAQWEKDVVFELCSRSSVLKAKPNLLT